MRRKTLNPNASRQARRILTAALVSGFAFAQWAKAEVRFSWDPVPEAAYYEGTFELNGESTEIRTSSSWLLLDPNCSLRLTAFDANGHKLKPIVPNKETSRTPANGSAAVARSAAPLAAPQAQQTEQKATEEKGTEQKEAADASSGADDWELDDGDDSKEKAVDAAPSTPARAEASLAYGLGREWLNANAGVSSYSDASIIGGTTLRGEWQGEGAKWYLKGYGEAHNFLTSNADGSQASYLVGTLRALVFLDMSAGHADLGVSHISFGVGLNYQRLPMLVINNTTTDTAVLQDRTFASPIFAARVSRQLSDSDRLSAQVEFQPLAFTWGIKALGATADVDWQRAFSETFYGTLGMVLDDTRLQASQDCLAAANCQNFSQSTASTVMLRFGVGLKL